MLGISPNSNHKNSLNSPQIALDHKQFVVLGDQLQVEWSSGLKALANALGNVVDLGQGLLVQVLGRGHQGGVSGVDSFCGKV
jgi:hypothetical protein